MNPVIALTITDFKLFPNQKELISQFKLLEKKHLIEYSYDIELIFIELPKFTKTEEELSNIQDKWLYFIKNVGSLEYVPKNLSKEIEKAFQIANEANFNEEELELQYRKRDWIYIQKSSIELASKTGREEGKLVERKQISIKMHQANVDIEVISQVTGLTVEEIKTLIQT